MNPNETWQSSQDLSVAAFHAVRHLLPDKDAATISGYIYEASEWGLGVEAIFDTLVESNVKVSRTQKRTLDAAAESMGLDHDQAKLFVSDS